VLVPFTGCPSITILGRNLFKNSVLAGPVLATVMLGHTPL
jgi:hypothetical protein